MPSRAREFFTFQPSADYRWARLGFALWCVVFLSIAGYSIASIIRHGDDHVSHTVSTVYWKAAHQWWNSEEMYGSKEPHTREGLHGFLYFPQAAVLFTPLAYMPLAAAEVLWRLLSLSMVAWALWRMCRIFAPPDRAKLWFGLGTFLAMPALCLSSQNGQCNLILLALSAHATVDMIQRRWWPATILLCLGLALKPHMLVFILLLFVLQPPMRWRLLAGVAGAAALAWVNPDWTYVWQQHISFVQKMRVASHPPPGTEQDLVTLLWKLGYTLPDRAWLVIRLAGAGAASLLALVATRRFERRVSLLFVMTLAIQYIMIFNPRTEGPTHAMMGISMALFTLQELTLRRGAPLTRQALAWAMVAACILLGLSHGLIHPTNRWMQPTLEIWFAVYLSAQIIRGRPVFGPLAQAPAQAVRPESALAPARGAQRC